MNTIAKIFLVLIAYLAIDFAISALIVKGICWAFSLTFSWKIAFGFWLILLILHGTLSKKE
jgi:hypothetical protein